MRGGIAKVKILLITVAGMSSRFSASIGKSCLKCLYTTGGIEKTLLWRMVHISTQFDRYVIVGGYMYDQLQTALEENFPEYASRICLVKNEKYESLGSGYSLYVGIKEALRFPFDELVFAEGDLFVDRESFQKVIDSTKNVITVNKEMITADGSVVFYYDGNHKLHYLYDTGHRALEIKEPFTSICNSGQIWKFTKTNLIKETLCEMDDSNWRATNLGFVERYFQRLHEDEYEVIAFNAWINCNTVSDYQKIEACEVCDGMTHF